MAWYDEALVYHIYPLGLTGAPKENHYNETISRLDSLFPWIDHIQSMGFTALYIGPLFESVGHGYETTDYKRLDSRLGTNEDLKRFIQYAHQHEIRIIFDGVFNHTGRDFFAFRDIREKREGSAYTGWYCNVNFWGNNEYNDGFSYDNWGGFNLLAKLNHRNAQVSDYMLEVVRFWIEEFDVDGIRLDAADVLDFGFMQKLRAFTRSAKADFWLMGEVIHGDYTRWVNAEMLHSVTNYQLHKALYSGHNDHNYFEIAHTLNRFTDLYRRGISLYNFVDNHDVERIASKLNNKSHLQPVYILLYTIFGIPSVYYGSEFAIEGRKEKYSDASLRPELHLEDYSHLRQEGSFTELLFRLGKLRKIHKVFAYGDYTELLLTNRQFAYSRAWEDEFSIIALNNDDHASVLSMRVKNDRYHDASFVGMLYGKEVQARNGQLEIELGANSGEIYLLIQNAQKDVEAERISKSFETEISQVHSEAEEGFIKSKIEQTGFATIGTGTIVEDFLDGAREHAEFFYQATYSRDRQRAVEFSKKHHSESIYDQPEAMFSDQDVDAVYIASPNSLHAKHAIAAMQQKKHVFCEKPLASNLREVQEMFAAAKEHGVVLLEAMRPIHDPGFFLLKEAIAKIGRVRKAYLHFCKYSSAYDEYKQGKIANRFDPNLSAGALMDLGVYPIEVMVALFGKPKEVKASSILFENGIDGATSAICNYDGMLVYADCSKICANANPCVIEGEKGSIYIPFIRDIDKITIRYNSGEEQELLRENCENTFRFEVGAFLSMIRGQGDVEHYAQISLQTMEILDEIRRQCNLVFPADRN